LIRKFVLEMGPPLDEQELLASRGREGMRTVQLQGDDLEAFDGAGIGAGASGGEAGGAQGKSERADQEISDVMGMTRIIQKAEEEQKQTQKKQQQEEQQQQQRKKKQQQEKQQQQKNKKQQQQQKEVEEVEVEEVELVEEVEEVEEVEPVAGDAWDKHTDEQGKQFYYNSTKKMSQWEVVEGLLGEAMLANHEGRLKDAFAYSSKATTLDPTNGKAWIEQGRVMCSLGHTTGEFAEFNVAGAYCCFEKALQCSIEDAELRLDIEERMEALEPLVSEGVIETARAFVHEAC
jgi:hypothetical protein